MPRGEPVSPELVLVDPELAKVARRSLPEMQEWRPRAQSAPARATLRAHAVRRQLPRAALATTTAAPLLLLLVVGSVVVALVASEVRAQFLDPAASLEPQSASLQPVGPDSGAAASWPPTAGDVEARVIALLVAGKAAAPAALSDGRSLLADYVRVSCRRLDGLPRFTCRVGVGPSTSREWRLTVTIRRGDSATLAWRGRVPS